MSSITLTDSINIYNQSNDLYKNLQNLKIIANSSTEPPSIKKHILDVIDDTDTTVGAISLYKNALLNYNTESNSLNDASGVYFALLNTYNVNIANQNDAKEQLQTATDALKDVSNNYYTSVTNYKNWSATIADLATASSQYHKQYEDWTAKYNQYIIDAKAYETALNQLNKDKQLAVDCHNQLEKYKIELNNGTIVLKNMTAIYCKYKGIYDVSNSALNDYNNKIMQSHQKVTLLTEVLTQLKNDIFAIRTNIGKQLTDVMKNFYNLQNTPEFMDLANMARNTLQVPNETLTTRPADAFGKCPQDVRDANGQLLNSFFNPSAKGDQCFYTREDGILLTGNDDVDMKQNHTTIDHEVSPKSCATETFVLQSQLQSLRDDYYTGQSITPFSYVKPLQITQSTVSNYTTVETKNNSTHGHVFSYSK
jgi:hypothetical protein